MSWRMAKAMAKLSYKCTNSGISRSTWARNTNPYPDHERLSFVPSMMRGQRIVQDGYCTPVALVGSALVRGSPVLLSISLGGKRYCHQKSFIRGEAGSYRLRRDSAFASIRGSGWFASPLSMSAQMTLSHISVSPCFSFIVITSANRLGNAEHLIGAQFLYLLQLGPLLCQLYLPCRNKIDSTSK